MASISFDFKNFISDTYIYNKSLDYDNPEEYIDDIHKCGRKIGGGLLVDPDGVEWKAFFAKYNTIDSETRKTNARRNLLRNNHLKTKLSLKEKLSALPDIIKSFSTEEVGYEQMLKRLDICTNCDYLSNINNEPACGVCGCPLNPNNKILNILAKKETSEKLCKHPEGSQWLKNNC